MSKKKEKICLVTLCIVWLAAVVCVNFYLQSGNNKTVVQKQSLGKVNSIEQAFDCKKVLKKEFSNLKFAKEMSVKQVEAIGVNQVIIPDLRNQNDAQAEHIFKRILENYGLEKTFDKKYISEDPNAVPVGPIYDDGKIFLSVGSDGSFDIQMGGIRDESDQLVKTYYVSNESSQDSYQLREGKMTIAQAKEIFEKNVKECIEEVGYDLQYKVQRILVYQKKSGECYYEALLQQQYKGIPIANVENKSGYTRQGTLVRSGASCIITGRDKKDMLVFQCYDGSLKQQSEKKCEQIMSVSEATHILNKRLNFERTYMVKDLVLEYCLMENAIDSANTDPCWTFYLSTDYGKEIVAYVDCITKRVDLVCNE